MSRLSVIRVYKSVKGGGGVHVRLLELLPRLAWHVDLRVLCYRERGDRAGDLERAGVPVDVVPMGSKWAPWNVGRYVAYFRTHRPHVVHTHEYTANTLMIHAAWRAGVPVRVRHLHSMAPWGWAGPVRTRLRVAADRRAARRARVTLAVSEAVRQVFLGGTGLPPASCRVLYNGVDLSRFEGAGEAGGRFRAELGIPGDAPVAGVLGRLARGKGHGRFLEAARRVAEREPRARFLVVGEGGLRPGLEARARDLGLGNRVIFTGLREDVPAALGAMDVLVFPGEPDSQGRIQDGLPGVVIEALAAGTPVAAFDLPMMGELLGPGVPGAVVPCGDAGALAEAVLGLLGSSRSDPGVRDAARRAARRFSLERCVDETLELYRALAAGRTE